jgi:fatty acid/phospholipid biosynthesis enzyme
VDGFSGNILIKTIEGYSEVIQNLLELQEASELDRQLTEIALAQYVQMVSAIKKLDYKEVGGAHLSV